jgi:hypothetical protein
MNVRLTLLEQPAVAGEWISSFGADYAALDLFRDTLIAVGPFDQQPSCSNRPSSWATNSGSPWKGAVVSKISFCMRRTPHARDCRG